MCKLKWLFLLLGINCIQRLLKNLTNKEHRDLNILVSFKDSILSAWVEQSSNYEEDNDSDLNKNTNCLIRVITKCFLGSLMGSVNKVKLNFLPARKE